MKSARKLPKRPKSRRLRKLTGRTPSNLRLVVVPGIDTGTTQGTQAPLSITTYLPMAAIARYKVLREFVHEGLPFALGNALILDEKEGEALIKEGKVQLVEYLDPENAEDADKIKHFKRYPSGGHVNPHGIDPQKDEQIDVQGKADRIRKMDKQNEDTYEDNKGEASDRIKDVDDAPKAGETDLGEEDDAPNRTAPSKEDSKKDGSKE